MTCHSMGNQFVQDPPPVINSREWWDQYFASSWDANGGSAQTRYFMRRLIASLPEQEVSFLRSRGLNILDWGCAFGEGVQELSEAFPGCKVSGLDFSVRAIEEAGRRNPGHSFCHSDIGTIPASFDVIVTSNCLEHFADPLAVALEHIRRCRFLYLLLVPFMEHPLHEQHRSRFDVNSFPENLGEFLRIEVAPIDVDPKYWNGMQVAVIYGSEQYVKGRQKRLNLPRSEESEQVERLQCLVANLKRSGMEQLRELEAERALRLQLTDELNQLRSSVATLDEARTKDLQAESRRRERIQAGIQGYRQRFELELSVYRNQRAWQAMLYLRKAYTLLLGRGFAGPLAALRWLASLPWKNDWGLAEYDLIFPDVGHFLPPDLWHPAQLLQEFPRTRAESFTKLGYDVIVLPVFEFDFRYQRPQQLAVQFARAGHRVFWISPSRPSRGHTYQLHELQDNLWEVQLGCTIPNIYQGAWDESGVSEIVQCLNKLFLDHDVTASCAMLQLPFWRQVGVEIRRRHGAKVVYDCMDHWETFPDLGEFIRQEETKLAGEADLLVVTSQCLFEKHSANGLSPFLVRNGADFDFFSASPAGGGLADIPRPIIGYFGAIADWFDFDLIRHAARSRPNYSFVLIGGFGLEAKLTARIAARLDGLPNVHLLGHKSYASLPSYLNDFDVCMIPFLLNQVTMATDPVKLYEYLSQGKPVVATAMNELKRLSDLVYIAENTEEFVRQLDIAVQEDRPGTLERRVEFARSNSWQARYQALDVSINGCFPLVSILVVTHNSAQFIRLCLDAIQRNTSYPNYEIVIVDNCSSDGTVQAVREQALGDSRISVISLDRNEGFARANNRAVGHAQGEYFMLLNPDTMVTAGWLERLISVMRREPRVGLVGPVTNCAGNQMRISVQYRDRREMECFAFHLASQKRGETLEISMAPLFCTLVRASLWRNLGGLDESFEVGMFEDDDFSLRVHKAGYTILCAEDCFVHHFGAGSFNQLSREVHDKVFAENRQRFEAKWKEKWIPPRYRPSVEGDKIRFIPDPRQLDFVPRDN
jgi:GT2 family glycosyltransferase/glycosyltransferase involved in cell wall biosynthesis